MPQYTSILRYYANVLQVYSGRPMACLYFLAAEYHPSFDGTPLSFPIHQLCAGIQSLGKNYTSKFQQIFCQLPVTVARSYSDCISLRCVLPVLWMTSCFYVIERMARIRRRVGLRFVQFVRWRQRGTKSAVSDCIVSFWCRFW